MHTDEDVCVIVMMSFVQFSLNLGFAWMQHNMVKFTQNDGSMLTPNWIFRAVCRENAESC